LSSLLSGCDLFLMAVMYFKVVAAADA